ncbi:hypothetical protein CIL05_13870 [Virgibacillus profundi]|uniref:Aminodeoxychorismate lyase n=1 Tax=Virgibacillus profundi TaxID=2024555 RepID=A0A2A2IBR3_9BACI|nr:hypothetical protein [Virgibacillus profundi]PAV29057.1 hypothetical protein CIL05_13870 [Virgibacillus profundi]PXY53226.1 hypothetical protein CIT14_13995 [Virgibacillus profundi]
MKKTVRSFAIGLLTAGIIMLVTFYFVDEPEAEGKTVEDMIPLVEQEGFRVITEEEYISLSVKGDENNAANNTEEEDTAADESEEEVNDTENNAEDDNTSEEDASTEEDTSEEETTEEDEVITYTLTIASGMASTTVSSLLEDNQIIEDSNEFNQYLNDQDYGLKIQIGEYELTSDLSFYEIAEIITK